MREGWSRVALGDVIAVNPKSPPLAVDAPFITMDAVPVGGRFPAYSEARGSRSGARAAGGDTLLARITPCLENGKVAQIPAAWPACGGSTELITLRATDAVIPDFVFLLATSHSFRRGAEALMTGTTGRQRVSASDIASVDIDLPPLDEQRRIVDLIGSLDATIAATDQAVAKAEQARRGTLHEAVSRARQRVHIGEVAVVRGGKRLPRGTPWAVGTTQHPYIRVVDMKAGKVDLAHLVHVPDDVWPSIRRYVVDCGDVLVSIAGTIGLIAQVPPSLEGANLTENAARISVDGGKANPCWVAAYLEGPQGQRAIAQRTVGTTQKKLGLFRIEQIPIPLLDKTDEATVCGVLDALAATATQARSTAALLGRLRQSLLSDLLKGDHLIPYTYDRLLEAA